KAAIGPGDHVLAARHLGESHDALGNEFGVFDEIAGGIKHAGDQNLAVKLRALPYLPFVGMPGVGSLERDSADLCLENDIDDVLERNVAMMRAFVVAPAQMDAN